MNAALASNSLGLHSCIMRTQRVGMMHECNPGYCKCCKCSHWFIYNLYMIWSGPMEGCVQPTLTPNLHDTRGRHPGPSPPCPISPSISLVKCILLLYSHVHRATAVPKEQILNKFRQDFRKWEIWKLNLRSKWIPDLWLANIQALLVLLTGGEWRN